MLRTWVLSSFYKGDDTHNAQSVQDTKGETIWVVPGLDCNRVGDIDDDSYCDCFKHLSNLSLYVFFSLGSRNVEGAGSGSRTRRDGAYSPPPARTRGEVFVAIRAASGLLARGAHPFALSLQCLHGRGLTGPRLRWHTLAGVPSGLGWRCVQSYPLRCFL